MLMEQSFLLYSHIIDSVTWSKTITYLTQLIHVSSGIVMCLAAIAYLFSYKISMTVSIIFLACSGRFFILSS